MRRRSYNIKKLKALRKAPRTKRGTPMILKKKQTCPLDKGPVGRS